MTDTTTATVAAVAISGATYPHRRAFRAAGALWSRDRGAYVVAEEKAAEALAIADAHGLEVEAIDAHPDEITPATGERLRAIRQDRIDRRAERLRERADSADRRADEAAAWIKPHEREFLRLCEPVKRGHHSERRHRRLIERAQDAPRAEVEERAKAARLRRSADGMQRAQVAGDAEKRHEAARAWVDANVSPGDLVEWLGMCARVAKVNAKSVRIVYEGGHNAGTASTVDKTLVRLVEKGAPDAVPNVRSRFRKGDLVTVRYMARRIPGEILRRTPKGYSVRYCLGRSPLGGGDLVYGTGTFQDAELEPREEGAAS